MQTTMNRLAGTLALLLLASVADAELNGPPEGRQQLVDAIDAAWVRALDDGSVRAIVARHDAQDLVINMADCLPDPEVTRYPDNPTGTLKRILDERNIRVGYTNTGELDRNSTALYFTQMGDEMIDLILQKIAAHYETGPINQTIVNIPPPFKNDTFLNEGKVDILGLVNALGGSTKGGERRRKARRYSCTMTATGQYLWMLRDGGPGWQSVDDALAAEGAHFCAGPLSNELTKTYFGKRGNTSKTEFFNDLSRCLAKLANGEADAMVNPLPDERFFPEFIDTDGDGKAETATKGLFRAVNTMIVAGTPLWVAVD